MALGAALAFVNPARADLLAAGDPADLFTIETAVGGLRSPTSFAWLPDGRIVIADRNGDVLIATVGGTAEVIGNIPIDVEEGQQGVLNVVVHPEFATNRTLIFATTGKPPPATGRVEDSHRISAIPLDENGKLDLMKEKILVTDLKPFSKHDGGALAIGPDGKLYIGSGDNGCTSGKGPEPVYDPYNYFATCFTNANGKILRINLDGTIPEDNPLVDKTVTSCGGDCSVEVTALPKGPAREQIWAWGFRNPWRFWFDPKTGNLWEGDVGEVSYEELNIIPPDGGGRHYGWPWREADRGHPKSTCASVDPGGECVDPVYYCSRGNVRGVDGNCRSIMAGEIVDSCQFPESFRGRYFFGDYTNTWIATLDVTPARDGVVKGSRKMFIKTEGGPVHITVGPDGALYYAMLATEGKIQRVTPKNPVRCPSDPQPRDGGTKPGSGGAANEDGGNAGGATAETGGATGTGGADPGTRDAGAGGSGGEPSTPPSDLGVGNGCDCSVSGTTRATSFGWLSLLALPLLAGRRRAGRR